MISQNRIAMVVAAVCLALPLNAAAQEEHARGESQNQWIAAGFVGSNFANDASPVSTNIGGSLAHLWRKQWGAELDLGFTPNFKLQNNFFGLGVVPQVNSYMANALWAKAFGADGQWRPFVSGGVGALSLRSGITSVPAFSDVFDANDTRFGGNIGAGFMGFAGNWGFKADVRYFRATGTYNPPTTASNPNPSPSPSPGNPTPTPGPYGLTTGAVTGVNVPMPADMGTSAMIQSPASAALTGLHFWRANVGVAFRWPR
jgi:hypothetical protein